MGEVTLKVKLTNAADEVNALRGLIPPTEVRHVEIEVHVDCRGRKLIPNSAHLHQSAERVSWTT